MADKSNMDSLIARVISGNATEGEIAQIGGWMAESTDNRKEYEERLEAWNASGSWISAGEIQRDRLKIAETINKNLVSCSLKSKRLARIYRAAAILAFPIAIGLTVLFFESRPSEALQHAVCEISAPSGHISQCKLPDGTNVWINSNSKITYDPELFGDEARSVQLDGEAYFEVAKNKRKPFYVRTSLADVKVTGTSFNVKAFSDSELFETVLSEGHIELELNRESKQRVVELEPGERASYDLNRRKLQVQDVDTPIYTAWRNGQVIFKDATLGDLTRVLEKIYGVKFRFKDPDMERYRFRGMFSYNNNLIDALEKFKITAKINYYIKDKEVWLSKE